ncbi:hypothetical protein SJAG_01184 [Schizosaccharomyces japonicus yFS275]|uniref:Nitrogen permease regulator 3 n=1 Tax=Schizosaccharomyces japonicus (strain yFS275 / FY16936) TaxID=402676 RepID=B6JZZ5_SCHJY|nr:hypothetical protein SJAG_01184 [Schizosaccharomyces japonicus yFS275]EEB06145.1 hypothetical protein SJAG_01184 [Schizosaccharomyces japonicus yFS275]
MKLSIECPSIIAVFLIEKSSSGSSFVFHWPVQPKLEIGENPYSFQTTTNLDDLLNVENDEDLISTKADDYHVLGYEKEFLANFLSPKQELCNQKFELWVDGLTFLGCPIHVGADGEWVKRRKHNPEATMESKNSTGPEQVEPNMSSTPKVTRSRSKRESRISMFHVVFVLNIPTGPEYLPMVTTMYEHILVKLSTALKYEQAKRNYVARECRQITRLTEKCINQNIPFNTYASQIPNHSNLAAALASTFEAISRTDTAHLLINNSIDLSLLWPQPVSTATIEHPELPSRPSLILASQTIFSEEESSPIEPFLAPHWSLLLLQEPEVLMKSLPLSKNSLLASFIANAKPSTTFIKLARTLAIPLSECFMLAKHLIHWRQAIAIPPITPRGTYVTSPTADLSKLASDSILFQKVFPSLPSLSVFLGILSFKPRPFMSIIPSKDHESIYLNMLAWLYRRKWVYEQNTYLYIRVPESIKQKASTILREDKGTDVQLLQQLDADSGQESIINDPHSASLLEQQWLITIANEQEPDLASLFLQIAKYFNGRHALQTISIIEGLPRKAVRNVISRYKLYLIRWNSW